MTTNHFKTVAFSMIAGAIGGLISGSSLGAMLGLPSIVYAFGSGEFAAAFVVPLFGMFGALYGLVGGIAAGFLGGVGLAVSNTVAKAPIVGKWFGAAIGGALAASFAVNDTLPVNQPFEWASLVLIVPIVAIGAVVGALGGNVAGRILLRLMASGRFSAETAPTYS